jgi:pimeloyl-ACP methyl ester carboxylesterase
MKSNCYHIPIITAITFLLLSCNPNAEKNTVQATQKNNTMEETLKMQVKVRGEGPPMLLVPGGLTGWQSWEPFVDTFTAQQKQVISVQLLNVQYGLENRNLPGNYSVSMESEALAATLDTLKHSLPLDIVAWSYGALISLDYALDHPGRVRTLTLIEPPAFWVFQTQGLINDETQQTIDFHNTYRDEITEDMLAAFLQDAGLVREGESARELPQWENWVSFRYSLRLLPAVYAHSDNLKRLQNLNIPVLLINGTGSSQYYHQIIDNLAAHLPNAHVAEMPAGHVPHLVSRDRFLSVLERFQKGN